MVRPVSLSEPAFAALRKEKRVGESDSDVVLRLIATVRASERDPRKFLRGKREWAFTEEEYDEMMRKMDEADRRDPWHDASP